LEFDSYLQIQFFMRDLGFNPEVMKRFTPILILIFTLFQSCSESQVKTDPIAEAMLVVQRVNGGWPKHLQIRGEKELKTQYKKLNLTDEELATINRDSAKLNTTYDNYATSKEIRYLIKAYHETQNPAYLKAAQKGIQFILDGQYANGGWPQFYPLKGGYADDITYNDNAMVNSLNILRDIVRSENGFEVVDSKFIKPSEVAIEMGIDCILKTQIKIDDKLTVWCAQHDRETFAPSKARAYELPSLSGQESVGIIEFLMGIKNPSPEVINAIQKAMQWVDENKIEGYGIIFPEAPGTKRGFDRVLVEKDGSVLWARFYDLETGKPFFCGRDGVKKDAMSEIEIERRIGYGWYGDWPAKLLNEKYQEWKRRNGIE